MNTKLTIYQVDAFTQKVFEGNPAAVVPLTEWLPDETLQKIALENNLSETAFFVATSEGFHIRWFTPVSEVNLCGHATLATAHVLFHHLNYSEKEIRFESRSGLLLVKRTDDRIVLNFPSSEVDEVEIPQSLKPAFNIEPIQCFKGREDYLLIFKTEDEVLRLNPNFSLLAETQTRGIIASAKSEKYDFVSRFFAPAVGINEDPVTGSAHTMLIPFWAKKLGKTEMSAKQVSARGGVLTCTHLENRVEMGGNAATYLVGEIFI